MGLLPLRHWATGHLLWSFDCQFSINRDCCKFTLRAREKQGTNNLKTMALTLLSPLSTSRCMAEIFHKQTHQLDAQHSEPLQESPDWAPKEVKSGWQTWSAPLAVETTCKEERQRIQPPVKHTFQVWSFVNAAAALDTSKNIVADDSIALGRAPGRVVVGGRGAWPWLRGCSSCCSRGSLVLEEPHCHRIFRCH